MEKARGTIGELVNGSFWLPKASSTGAAETDLGWAVAYWVSVVFFFLVVIPLAYFVWKYRRKGEQEIGAPTGHNTAIEIIWTVIPLAVVMACFLIGFRGYMNMAVAPAEALEIQATAKKWSWTFTYPNGKVSPGELHVPAGRAVKTLMSSTDVLHSFYVPEFRVKHDVIPGTYTSVWFNANEPGETTLFCTEYCGKDHSNMLAKVVIHTEDDFKKWLEAGDNRPPAERGQSLFTQFGCAACHSTTGVQLVGPSIKGLFGKQENIKGVGPVAADENYLRESILVPAAKVVEGFAPIMPAFKGQMTDEQVNDLIAYIKTVK